jgi:hypothetical protein
VLLVVAAIDVGVVACGRSNVWFPGDAYEGGGDEAGRGGSAGKGGLATGGTGGSMNTGGTGGSGGSGNFGNGGTVSTGGSGIAGSAALAGAAGAAPVGPGPFACVGVKASCDSFSNFSSVATTTWGFGSFSGGITVFGSGLMHTDGASIHVVGTVSDYGSGIVLWFTNCADLSNYSGVTFTVSGSTFTNSVEFMPLMNSDYPWQPRPEDQRGACTSENPGSPWTDCIEPLTTVALGPSPQFAYWNSIMGGYPVSWNQYTGPLELVGLEWHFPYNAGYGPYMVDLTLDNVSFIGGTGNDCGPGIGGMGGMGGMGGAGNGGVAGSAGWSGMPGGAGGMSGRAGSSGAGGTAGRGAAGDGGTTGGEGGVSAGGDGAGGA